MRNFNAKFLISYGIFILSQIAIAQSSYSPNVDRNFPENVYWGDTHLHTNLSVDANMFGNKNLGLEASYRFAKGEVVVASNGMKARLSRPLDFLVIADHAYNLGVSASLNDADSALLQTPSGKRLYDEWKRNHVSTDTALQKDSENQFILEKLMDFFNGSEGKAIKEESYAQSIWQRVTESADTHNQPGKFTAFIGYEWTSWWKGSHHRVVIFKDAADKANKIIPFSLFDSQNPADLWRFLQTYQDSTGGEAFAIPHNGNASNGYMFSLTDYDGNALSEPYAALRSRWEPLYEVTQIKGDGETHPLLSPTDEFADYETWDSWEEDSGKVVADVDVNKRKAEYARSALMQGLGQQATLKVNPFKFGMIGSTDSHTSLSAVEENNFWGKSFAGEPAPDRLMKGAWGEGSSANWKTTASGYAAVWAEENSRESLFAAMKRKEVYATTGPRITVRFFGGWNYEKDDALRPNLAEIGYAKGVPMGGDLTSPPERKTPTFLIRAVKDPDGANLDRVQVIKGRRDQQGVLHETIYNVALSDNRKVGQDNKVEPVGSTVNIKDASYTNSIGDTELSVVWLDPNFDQNELAFYYLRVLEIPTPRWTAYDAKFFDIKAIPDHVPMITQERAYTSPIWYTP